MEKITKHSQVKNHLITLKSITSMEAIELYGATRLSAIIYNLRDKGHTIETKSIKTVDRNGNSCIFAKYIYLPKEK